MAQNPFFNNYSNSREQNLLDNLIRESIQIYGAQTYYCPRTLVNKDDLYEAASISSFDANYPLEMHIRTSDGFVGDGEFFSKFLNQIRPQMTLTVSITRFREEVPNQDRPNESDLIFIPMTGQIFFIKAVNYKPVFYQLATLLMYDLICEPYEYSSEILNTGIPEIDNMQKEYTLNVQDWAILTQNGNPIATQNNNIIVLNQYGLLTQDTHLEDNTNIKDEYAEMEVFTEDNPFGKETF